MKQRSSSFLIMALHWQVINEVLSGLMCDETMTKFLSIALKQLSTTFSCSNVDTNYYVSLNLKCLQYTSNFPHLQFSSAITRQIMDFIILISGIEALTGCSERSSSFVIIQPRQKFGNYLDKVLSKIIYSTRVFFQSPDAINFS